jgi:small subunit ribosomal protein S16
MLAIRMQRIGRKGSAQFRVVVQDSRRTPTSGNIVALVGHYDPHAKTTTIDKEKISFYLSNGAQPSDRVIKILQHEKVEIPTWVKLPTRKTASIKDMDKLRRNRPAKEVVAEPEAAADPEPVAEVAEETPQTEETTAETTEEVIETNSPEVEESTLNEAEPATEKDESE